MLITRIYTGADGQSHFEDMDPAGFPNPQSLTAVTSVRFRVSPPGAFSDWHRESRRNYIITLSGEGEIGVGDGTRRRFGPGAVMLVEDLTGQGHTTRVTSAVPRVTLAVPLANQTPGT
jgi:quercetin dioxygenase-like cupin family protein